MCKQSEQFKEKILHLKVIKKKNVHPKHVWKKQFLKVYYHMEITIKKGWETLKTQYPVHLKTSVTETEWQHV